MKKWAKCLIGLSAMSLLYVPPAFSAAPSAINIYIDGQLQKYDVVPYIKNDRTMVPFRGIAEAVGATVIWTPDKPKLVVVKKDTTTVTMTLFQNQAQVNGQTVTLDQPSELHDDRTFVPVRFLTEALGCDVTWDAPTNHVNILSGVYPVGQYSNRQALNLAEFYDIYTLDCVWADDTYSNNVIGQIGEGLTRIDASGKVAPGVATSWDISNGGKTYTFHLRPDAKWSDGSAVTAQDFVYAWKRTLTPNAQVRHEYLMEVIQGAQAYNRQTGSTDQVAVQAVDNQTLQVTLTNPMPYFLSQTATPAFFPQKQSFVQQVKAQNKLYGSDVQTTLSNGPFLLRDWVHGRYAILTRNPNYWDSAHVKLDKVGYYVYSNSLGAEAAYQQGTIDRYRVVGGTQYERLKTAPDLETIRELVNGYFNFNLQNPVLKNANIRKALTYAVDADALSTAIFDDAETGANGFVPSGTDDGTGTGTDFRADNGDVMQRATNAAQAKTLLQKGLSELGLTTMPTLTLLLEDDSYGRRTFTNLQSQWSAKLGININAKYLAIGDLLQAEQQKQYDIAVDFWGADYNDPLTFLGILKSGDPFNTMGYSNPQYDQLLTAAENETDPAARLQDLKTAETTLMSDMPVGPLIFRASAFMKKPYVQGFITHPFGPEYDLRYAYIQQE